MTQRTAEQIRVNIKVHTTISNGDEKQTFEVTTIGQYYQKQASAFLQYDEKMEDGIAKTTLKLTDNEISLSRSGAVKMRMRLHPESPQRGSYSTPYGEFLLLTNTHSLKQQWDATTRSGLIEVTYDLTIQGDKAGTYHLQIQFEEEQQ